MIKLFAWREENGEIMTKATKAQLTKRVFELEAFLWACVCCNLEKYQVSMTVKLMKSPHVIGNADMVDFYGKQLSQKIERYRRARRKRDNLFAVLTKGADAEDVGYEPTAVRPLNLEQAKRLLMVLRDNGIEADECLTVAEAVCYVTDLDESILQEVEL